MTNPGTLSDLDVARMVETTEAVALADFLRAAPPEWRCVAEETEAGWLLLSPAIDMLMFNRVIGCGLAGTVRQVDVETTVGRLRATGLRNYGVQLSPSAQPADLTAWLGECGLVARDRWAKVFRPADAPAHAPTDLRIARAGVDEAAVVAEVTTTGFGMPEAWRPWIAATVGRPHWHYYLAWSGASAVAAAALYVHGTVGWLGVASTLPAARRRGAQSALMAKRIEDGCALGCEWLVSETGEDIPARPNPSFHNMIRAGFTVAYHRLNYMPRA